MRYCGGDSAEEFLAWRRMFREKLEELRGDVLARPAPDVELLDRTELDDHVRQRIRINSVLGSKITAYLLLPRPLPRRPGPGVLAFHGHVPGGKEPTAGVLPVPADLHPADYGLATVRAGFVTICPDWWGWGERADPRHDEGPGHPCNVKFMAAQMYGVSLLSIMLSDATASLEALAARPEVDPQRIIVVGNSFGGRMSMWTAAMDDRVAGAVCAGAFNCFRERSLALSSCGAQYFPGLLRWGDMEEVFSSIAPRPLLVVCGRDDPLIVPEYADRMRPVVERAYAVLGAQRHLEYHEFDGGHFLPQGPVVAWLADRFG